MISCDFWYFRMPWRAPNSYPGQGMHDLRSHLCAKACDLTWSVVGWTCQGHSAHFGLEIKCQIVGLCRSLTFRLSAAFPKLRRIHKAVSCMISKDGVISCCLTFSLNSFVLRFRSVNTGGLHASRSEEATGEAERCVVHDWQSCDLGNTKPKHETKKTRDDIVDCRHAIMPSCHHGWRGHGIHWIHTFPPIHTFHVSFEKETFTLSLLSSSFHIFRVSEFKRCKKNTISVPVWFGVFGVGMWLSRSGFWATHLWNIVVLRWKQKKTKTRRLQVFLLFAESM